MCLFTLHIWFKWLKGHEYECLCFRYTMFYKRDLNDWQCKWKWMKSILYDHDIEMTSHVRIVSMLQSESGSFLCLHRAGFGAWHIMWSFSLIVKSSIRLLHSSFLTNALKSSVTSKQRKGNTGSPSLNPLEDPKKSLKVPLSNMEKKSSSIHPLIHLIYLHPNPFFERTHLRNAQSTLSYSLSISSYQLCTQSPTSLISFVNPHIR